MERKLFRYQNPSILFQMHVINKLLALDIAIRKLRSRQIPKIMITLLKKVVLETMIHIEIQGLQRTF